MTAQRQWPGTCEPVQLQRNVSGDVLANNAFESTFKDLGLKVDEEMDNHFTAFFGEKEGILLFKLVREF